MPARTEKSFDKHKVRTLANKNNTTIRMNPLELILGIVFILVLKIVSRFLAGHFDKERIKNHIEKEGGRLISQEWEPFEPGWFGENSERIYSVVYFDKEGIEHHAFAKTSRYSGVYFSRDRIIEYNKKIDYSGKSVFENIQESQKHNK